MGIDNKLLPVVVFMDLSKAFDTLDRTILIHITILWHSWDCIKLVQKLSLKSTSIGRYQWINILNETYNYRRNPGFHPGAIALSKLHEWSSKIKPLLKYILFADDTSLLSSIEYSIPINDTNMIDLMFMVFHPHQKDVKDQIPNLRINDTEIELVENFNFLGIQLDKNINWKTHTNLIANKLSKYPWILNRLKRYLPLFVLRMLYFCLVNSQISYGLLSWGFSAKDWINDKNVSLE